MADNEEQEKRKVNVKIFLEHMKQKLSRILDIICPDKNSSKDLVTVPEIRPLFELIIDPQTLKDRKVSLVWLDDESISKYEDPDVPKIIFFVPPTIRSVQLVKKFYKMLKKKNYDKKLYLIYYPKRSMMCKYYMDQEKMLVLFENSTYDFNFDLIPLCSDLLSLEYKPAVAEMLVSSEYTCYNLVAESIQRLQMVFGKVPSFLVKGDKAKVVFDILERLEKEHGNRLSYDEDVREVDSVIIMDRTVDLLTPFVTQLSYQGVLDEAMNIEINKIAIDRSVVNPRNEEGAPQDAKMNFYLTDNVFESIKDLDMGMIGVKLKEKLVEYKNLIDTRDANNRDIRVLQKMHNEVKKKKFVEPHVNIASHLKNIIQQRNFTKLLEIEQTTLMGMNPDEFVEEILNLILKKEQVYKIYRLLCIFSLAEGGFKTKQYEGLRKEMVETYGFEHLSVFNQLSQAGLLYNRDTRKLKSTYNFFKKTHKLINMEYQKEEPNRTSFPYSAYTPLTVRILENAFRQTWTSGDLVDKIPGYTATSGDSRYAAGTKTTRKVVVLYMVGGITYAEISCMRHLAKQYNIELLIAATNIVNYKRMLDPFLQ